MDNPSTILIVDDDRDIRSLLADYLEANGYRALAAADGTAMWKLLDESRPDLIVLDLNLPGDDGLTLCRKLRAHSTMPVIMLTARSEPLDRILGLEMGADDYLPKPFEPRELLLRLRNILRRAAGGSGPSEEVRMGNHVFHVSRGELKHNDETIKLTERERDLLRMFAQRIGSPIPRHELAPEDSTGSDRAIDVQINRLRRKIETDPSNPVYLQTVRGKGYILYSD
jgi:two-component system phosphate regulon response regulator OmpR